MTNGDAIRGLSDIGLASLLTQLKAPPNVGYKLHFYEDWALEFIQADAVECMLERFEVHGIKEL